MDKQVVTAALIIIGDEILSGRTQDQNLNFLAKELGEIGVNLKEVRVIPDEESEIINAVFDLHKKHDYVFTSGGIGPTHDDITADAIAKAFDDVLVKNEEAADLLLKHYGKNNLNEARLKMAFFPSKSKLIKNDTLSASGFRIENVFVLAGIPKIFQAMFDGAKHEIIGGQKVKSQEIKISLPEGVIAKEFSNLQKKYPQVVMGSYPSEGITSLVFRGIDHKSLELSFDEMIQILNKIQSDSILAISRSH
jgi:molybdenum cofactor synthesis domain-containing protein